MSSCYELTDRADEVNDSALPTSTPAGARMASGRSRCRTVATDRLVVEVDALHGLSHLERIVCLLRGRNHPVAGLSSDLCGDKAVVVVWGEGLHHGDDDALVLKRLRRLPGVLDARIAGGDDPH